MLGPFAIGDFVVRKSYNGDVVFKIVAIEGESALLRGACFRLMADAPVEDLIRVDPASALAALSSLEPAARKIVG